MADYPLLTRIQLATFTGRPQASFTDFADQALIQARVLFKIATGLVPGQFPDDPEKAELATLGILAMADAIYLSQPYQKAKASPFSSESIGSYSYSKNSGRSYAKTVPAVAEGLPAGVGFFDMAVFQLSIRNNGMIDGGGFTIDDGTTGLPVVPLYTPDEIEVSRSAGVRLPTLNSGLNYPVVVRDFYV